MNTKHTLLQFLQKKDINPSSNLYFVQATSAMAQGLFCSLLIGLILSTIGQKFNFPFLIFKLEKDFPELSSTSLFFENIENILILNKEKRILEETFKKNQKNKLTTVKRL